MREELIYELYYRKVKIHIWEVQTNNITSHRFVLDFRTIGIDQTSELTDLRPLPGNTYSKAIHYVDAMLDDMSTSWIGTKVLRLKIQFDSTKKIIEGAKEYLAIARALDKVIEINIKGIWMLIGPKNTPESVRESYYSAVLHETRNWGVKDLFKEERNELSMP